jgi:rhodanese-related sulfurtransferase
LEQSPQKIPGARWHDPETIHDWLDALPKDKDVVVYCVKGGSVSQSVTTQLNEQACRARFLEGGIKAWREAGGEVTE